MNLNQLDDLSTELRNELKKDESKKELKVEKQSTSLLIDRGSLGKNLFESKDEKDEIDSQEILSQREANDSNKFSLPEITDITHVSIKITEQSTRR